MRASIVIGAGYGDEGKGATVDSLTRLSQNEGLSPIVVRFGGGHQCGHRVVHTDKEHIFSNFGSGTLRGAPTYWAKGCTIEPVGFMKEYNILVEKGCTPTIYADPECLITTPWDINHNHVIEKLYDHGSTGVGFGATVSRNEGTNKLSLIELRSKYILDYKLNKFFGDLVAYYDAKKTFVDAVDEMLDVINIMPEYIYFKNTISSKDYIFEGNQGIMLDHEYGFYPHVTRSNTMSRGAGRIIDMLKVQPMMYYVTRAYGTRHGNGPFPGEEFKDELHLQNMEDEANKTHEWQGKFRTAPLNLDILDYATMIDHQTRNFNTIGERMIITCCDHIKNPKSIPVIKNGKLKRGSVSKVFDDTYVIEKAFTNSSIWSSL